jgi:hypothetical protein
MLSIVPYSRAETTSLKSFLHAGLLKRATGVCWLRCRLDMDVGRGDCGVDTGRGIKTCAQQGRG